jgi:hypothetical protein
VVSYFRWRQAPFAQEQMHAGLNLPNFEPDLALFEAAQVAKELSGWNLGAVARAKVALVYDYEAAWTLGIQPQGNNFDYMAVVLSFYRAFRRLGLNVDIISQRASLEPYSVVAIPSLPIVETEFVEALKRFRGQVLIASRAGSKTADFQIPQESAGPPAGVDPDLCLAGGVATGIRANISHLEFGSIRRSYLVGTCPDEPAAFHPAAERPGCRVSARQNQLPGLSPGAASSGRYHRRTRTLGTAGSGNTPK